MLVKLIQNQAHAVHETVHVRRCAIIICRALMCCKRFLKYFEILHPLECKVVWLNIGLVEDDYKRELGLVQDAEV